MVEKESKNFDDVLLSKKTLEGMSLNINDRVFFKRIMDQHFYLTQEYIAITYRDNLENILEKFQIKLDSHKEEILKSFDEKVGGLETQISVLQNDVSKLKKRNSVTSIAIRIAIAVAIAVILTLIIHKWYL